MERLNYRAISQRHLPYLVSGLLYGLSWPSYPYVWLELLAWVWMVPLLLALKSVKSFPQFLVNVYLATLIVSAVGMSWLIASSLLGVILLFFVGAIVFTVPFIPFYFLWKATSWRLALYSSPIIWTAWEWLYQQTEGSWAWLAMGVTQSNFYWMVQYADITGVWGITFWLVLFNVLVVMAIEDYRLRIANEPFDVLRSTFYVNLPPNTEPVGFKKKRFPFSAALSGLGGVNATSTQGSSPWATLLRPLRGLCKEILFLNLYRRSNVERRTHYASPDQQSARMFLIGRLAIITALMLLPPLAYSAYVFMKANGTVAGDSDEISVVMVQPNIDPWTKLDNKHRARALTDAIALTGSALARQKADLIIWPETAVPYPLLQNDVVKEFVYKTVSQWNVPLLTGVLDIHHYSDPQQRPLLLQYQQRDHEIFNAAVLLTPESSSQGKKSSVKSSDVYHKQMLMPFVERVPFSDRFPWLSHLAVHFGAGSDYSPGNHPTVFSFNDRQGREVKVAAMICYEQLFPAKVAEFVRGGAEVLALITNEGWWSKTHGAYQLAAFTRLRSIETRRAMARCANTGVSLYIDELGRTYNEARWWEGTTMSGRVKLSRAMSLYVRYPDYLPKACLWLLYGLGAALVIRRVRQSRFARSSSNEVAEMS